MPFSVVYSPPGPLCHWLLAPAPQQSVPGSHFDHSAHSHRTGGTGAGAEKQTKHFNLFCLLFF